MKIKSAKFIRGVTGTDEILEDGVPQVAFIGRSNVGKSSTINSLVGQKDLARTSSFPGRTQELNVFLITPEKGSPFYLVDLPGYGFAKGAISKQEQILKLIRWYLTDSGIEQKKVVLIIDASVGATANDLEMFRILQV
ncbi:MAG: ribosome biogenesis GTP-binding protein YihA/YsxC, partial [Patescibacteria group bacterium]